MSENIYPFQHSPYEDGPSPVNPFKDVLDMIRDSQVKAARIVEATKEQEAEIIEAATQKEELHKHDYRVTGGMYFAIRYCIRCGKSWRLPLRYDDFEDPPVAEWETISEPVDLSVPILPDYEG
ncbi:MAG TPA: hypothetical protein VHV10_16335 [Ktedonobacteraceae bacterium]|jgi:hypothetical protein|nr:hypothetical protein [Ktedonobacteraceae bacterium]